jgi:hypothetical protein
MPNDMMTPAKQGQAAKVPNPDKVAQERNRLPLPHRRHAKWHASGRQVTLFPVSPK